MTRGSRAEGRRLSEASARPSAQPESQSPSQRGLAHATLDREGGRRRAWPGAHKQHTGHLRIGWQERDWPGLAAASDAFACAEVDNQVAALAAQVGSSGTSGGGAHGRPA